MFEVLALNSKVNFIAADLIAFLVAGLVANLDFLLLQSHFISPKVCLFLNRLSFYLSFLTEGSLLLSPTKANTSKLTTCPFFHFPQTNLFASNLLSAKWFGTNDGTLFVEKLGNGIHDRVS